MERRSHDEVRVPASWLYHLQAKQPSRSESLLQQLNEELQSPPVSIPKEVAVAEWSRKALYRLGSKQLAAKQRQQEAEGPELAPGIAVTLEAARMHASTSAAHAGSTSSPQRRRVSLLELLDDRRRQLEAEIPFRPHKTATAALLDSAKLRAVAEQMLQRPGSYRVCQAEDHMQKLQERSASPSSYQYEAQLHELLLQVHLPSTLYTLMRAHLDTDMGAGAPAPPSPAFPRPSALQSRSQDDPTPTSPSRNAAPSAAPSQSDSCPDSTIEGALRRMKASDNELVALLQQSEQLRAYADRLCPRRFAQPGTGD